MFAVAFAYSEESKAEMLKRGYTEQTVMIKDVRTKKEGESELVSCRPYQFAVTDYWGAGPD